MSLPDLTAEQKSLEKEYVDVYEKNRQDERSNTIVFFHAPGMDDAALRDLVKSVLKFTNSSTYVQTCGGCAKTEDEFTFDKNWLQNLISESETWGMPICMRLFNHAVSAAVQYQEIFVRPDHTVATRDIISAARNHQLCIESSFPPTSRVLPGKNLSILSESRKRDFTTFVRPSANE